MELLKAVFSTADEGDRILMSFPDIYSFLGISKWISDNVGTPFWVLWTDAAVERINHLGRKYGFPMYGDAVIIGSGKECEFLNCIERIDIQTDLQRVMKALPLENRMIISFGLNFLEIYGYSVNKAIEMLIEHDRGVMVTAVIGNELVEKLQPFHDAYLEVSKSEDSIISYHNYVATLHFSVRGGMAVLSDTFAVEGRDPLE